MAKLPPIRIELRYDDGREGEGDREEPDSRLVRVEIEKRTIKPGTLRLSVTSPDDESGKVLIENAPNTLSTIWASDPAAAAGAEPCVVRVRQGTENYHDGLIEFRMELNTEDIFAFWGTMEFAASQEHPIVIIAEAETAPGQATKLAKRQGFVSINLNKIHWTWTPLRRAAKAPPGPGKDEPFTIEGPPQRDTPIEVDVDGTRVNGFKLELQRDERQKDGSYLEVESDFVHYLSPDHKCDFAVLAPKPIPWEIQAGSDQRQVSTLWWTQDLLRDHPILKQLPLDTILRVRAYPQNSVRKHVSGGRPKTKPEGAPVLATQLIPLRLGVAKWKTELVSPDMNEAPMVLEGDRPWEDSLPVEIKLFDDTDPSQVRLMKDMEVDWSMRPESDGQYCGMVKYGADKDLHNGTWAVDGDGRVKFRFCPTRENALFLAAKDNLCFRARFDVFPKGQQSEKRYPSSAAPDDKEAPSFAVDWAPKFDLAAFKLPFVIKPDATFDVEADPKEDTAEPVTLDLPADQVQSYRQIFRSGGTIRFQVMLAGSKGSKLEEVRVALEHYRLVVGEKGRKPAEKRQVIAMEPDSSSGSSEAFQFQIPALPDASAASGILNIKPQVSLHPEVEKYFERVARECAEVEKIMASSTALPAGKQFFGGDATTDFKKLALDFGQQALSYFGEAPQAVLVEKRKPIVLTMSAMPMFVIQAGAAWKRLGAAISFHRESYKRWEDAMVNFVFDVLLFKPVKDMLDKGWKWLSETEYGKWFAQMLTKSGIAQIKTLTLVDTAQKAALSAIIKAALSTAAKPIEDTLLRVRNALSDIGPKLRGLEAERGVMQKVIDAARSRFSSAVQRFSTHADEWMSARNQIREAMENARGAGMSAERLEETLAPLRTQSTRARTALMQAQGEIETMLKGDAATTGGVGYVQALRKRIVTECQYQGAQTAETALTEIQKEIGHGQSLLKSAMDQEGIPEGQVTGLSKLFEKMPDNISNAVGKARSDAGQYMDYAVQEHVGNHNTLVQKLTQLNENLGRAGNVPAELSYADSLPKMVQLQGLVSTNQSALEQMATDARQLLETKVMGAHAIWKAEKAFFDSQISRGMKRGELVMSKELRNALDGVPPPPPKSVPSREAPGWVIAIEEACTYMWEGVKSGFNWAISFLDNHLGHPSFLFMPLENMFSLLITYIGLLLRWLVFFPLNLFMRVMSRLVGKFSELLTHLFFNHVIGRNGWVRTSSLQEPALHAGVAAFDPSIGDLHTFFDFPYIREQWMSDFVSEAYDHYYLSNEPYDVQADQLLSESFRTGYEDYYPGQLKQARGLLHRLCARVLDRGMLETPPIEDDPSHRGFVALQAAEEVKRAIEDYLSSTAHASALQKVGFFEPVWGLLGEGYKWTSSHVEMFINWVGWLIAWGFRLAALVVAIAAWWTGPAAAAVAGALLLSASAVGAISAVCRAVFVALGFYPYSTAYPRDIVALQGLYFQMVFRNKDERFKAENTAEIVKS